MSAWNCLVTAIRGSLFRYIWKRRKPLFAILVHSVHSILPSGGGIHVFDKDGGKIGVIATPEHPANVCFGGDEYDTLFITARTGFYSVKTLAKGAKPKGAKW